MATEKQEEQISANGSSDAQDNYGEFSSSDSSHPAVTAKGVNKALGVQGTSDYAPGVYGYSTYETGVMGTSDYAPGVYGYGTSWGVYGEGGSGPGVYGTSHTGPGIIATSDSGPGIEVAVTNTSAPGIKVTNSSTYNSAKAAIEATSGGGPGIKVTNSSNYNAAIIATSGSSVGILATGLTGGSFTGDPSKGGVAGYFLGPIRCELTTTNYPALTLDSTGPGWGSGMQFMNRRTYGIYSGSDAKFHVSIPSQNYDLMTLDENGNLYVRGTVSAANIKLLLDHPLDPDNKSLSHAAVASSERKTIYDGVAYLDSHGEAEVTLPSWFEALNTEFRYQLTALSASAPNLYIAQKIKDHRFKIAGGRADMEVCWQVTGVRHDAWAKANPFEVEEDKSSEQLG